MYKWVFSERLKSSGDEHRRIASGRVFQARGPAMAKARSPSSRCETCGGINDRLQSVQLAAWQSGKGDVAVIQFGHDQTEDE